eukprot:TRINITY_DN5173_c0_g2_i1.p1 TRINITY_DN5173_c0_g2~~TRINITY_DN5173_c0_g2_i1.p1  ORF type:complete len:180 (+),score=24.39 TRINITY_DN5173_c0_g2_i1:1214-1753(+)
MHIRYEIDSNEDVVGDGPLSVEFPNLFSCATNQLAKVKDYMVTNNNQISWGLILRRNLREFEVENLFCFLQRLEHIFIPQEGSDCRVWIPSQDGVFSVSSFFSALSTNDNSKNQFEFLWKSMVLPRVIAFGWLVLRASIFTLDNLCKHKVTVVNACPLCLSAEESVDHLLLQCAMAQDI